MTATPPTPLAPTAPLTTTLASGFGHTAAGSVIGKVGTFATTILLARVLGPSAFGAFALVRATVTMFSSFSNLGLHATAARYLPRSGEGALDLGNRLLGFLLVAGASSIGAATLILVLASPTVAERIFDEPALAPLLLLGAVWLVGTAGTELLTAILAGLREFRSMALLAALSGVLLLSLLAALVWAFGGTASVAVAGYGGISVLTLLLAGAMVRLHVRERGLRPRIRWKRSLFDGPLLRFTLPAYLCILLQAPVSWFVLSQLATVAGGLALVGVVRVVESLRGALFFLPGVLYQVLLPVLSSAFWEHDPVSLSRGVRATTRLLWFLATPIVVLVGGSLPGVLLLLFGGDYARFAGPAAVLLTVALWAIPTQAHERVLAATGRMWLSLILLAGLALLLVGLALWLVPRFGLWGFVAAEGASYLAYGLALHVVVGRMLRLEGQAWYGMLAVGAVATTMTIVFAHLPILVALVASAFAATGLSALQWHLVLGARERSSVRKVAEMLRARVEGFR